MKPHLQAGKGLKPGGLGHQSCEPDGELVVLFPGPTYGCPWASQYKLAHRAPIEIPDSARLEERTEMKTPGSARFKEKTERQGETMG